MHFVLFYFYCILSIIICPIMEDIVADLKHKPFEKRNIAEKKEIINNGRPTPALTNKFGTRSFQSKWYEQLDWLCGCAVTDKLYCWPCLLFQPKSNQSWTHAGYNNFRNILVDSKYHSKSLSHLTNYKSSKCFGKCDIVTAISDA